MQYEWDEEKRLANLVRHKVDFHNAVDFAWDSAIETIDRRFNYGEERRVRMEWSARSFMYWFTPFEL